MERLNIQKPIKMFIYQPVYLAAKGKDAKAEYKKSTIVKFPFCRIEVGDNFTGEKRPADYFKLKAQSESKVVAIRYNLIECACIVILEKKVLKSEEDITRFVAGKGVV